MDLPSSPPPPPSPGPSRKRTRPSNREDSNPSSDLPVFSSDPPDPSLENYEERRSRKRQYRGAWWGSEVKSTGTQTRSAFSRNLDSGIFMGSDSTDDSLPSTAQVVEPAEDAVGGSNNDAEELDEADVPTGTLARAVVPYSRIDAARQIVEDALSNESQVIDFSNLQMIRLPGGILTPLHALTRLARFLLAGHSPADHEYEPLKPRLEIYLANNCLPRLPVELWSLDSLRVLSLRSNNLDHLPHSISRLRNLEMLDVTCNPLRTLPWELLSLFTPNGRLQNFHVMPNHMLTPFYLPESTVILLRLPKEREIFQRGAEELAEELRLNRNPSDWVELKAQHLVYTEYVKRMKDNNCDFTTISPIYGARTSVMYYHADGSPVTRPGPDHWSNTRGKVTTSLEQAADCDIPLGHRSRVPSLLELAAHSTLSVSSLSAVQELLDDTAPPAVLKLLGTGEQVRQEEGDRICSVCSRRYIAPRTEWIEFWHRPPVDITDSEKLSMICMDELLLPFLRRGCSWGCVG